MLDQDTKDEMRLIAAREIRDVLKRATIAAANPPMELGEAQHAMSPEGIQEREAHKKIAQRVGKAILEVAEANLREADARVIEKTDPERAKFVREFVPTY